MSFITHLEIAEVIGNHKDWSLTQPLTYEGSDETFTAPAGFVTNFASVPRIFWSILSPWGRHMKAAVMHDYFYQTTIVSRLDADKLFNRMMRSLGVSWWRRQTMYRMTRLFGAKHYGS